MPASHPSLAAVAGQVEGIASQVREVERTMHNDVRVRLSIVEDQLKGHRETSAERHAAVMERLDKLSNQGGQIVSTPKLFGLVAGTGREVALIVGALSVITLQFASAYIGGQAGTASTTAEVTKRVDDAVELIDSRIPATQPEPEPAPAAAPAPLR